MPFDLPVDGFERLVDDANLARELSTTHRDGFAFDIERRIHRVAFGVDDHQSFSGRLRQDRLTPRGDALALSQKSGDFSLTDSRSIGGLMLRIGRQSIGEDDASGVVGAHRDRHFRAGLRSSKRGEASSLVLFPQEYLFPDCSVTVPTSERGSPGGPGPPSFS